MRAWIHPSPRRGDRYAVSINVDSEAHWRRTKLSIVWTLILLAISLVAVVASFA
jgi:hypothetical protein